MMRLTDDLVAIKGDLKQMKKLMTLMLGMTLAFGTVAVTFAQDPPKKEEGKKAGKKGGKKKNGDESKKKETPK